MKSSELRQKYLDFFAKKGHKVIPSSSLVPQNDPTTLFTSSGMQPMVPYLLGEVHPEGKRIVDSQKVFRAVDIDEVGIDTHHFTLFEMLGNWSFGDYFKKEQLGWFFEFLTEELELNPQKLYVTAFAGNEQIAKDEETVKIWQDLFAKKGIKAQIGERIIFYGAEKNWWSRSGVPNQMPVSEPGGPDSEVFYLFENTQHNTKFGEKCHPNCDCGRFIEIGNSVFMQYLKQPDGSFKNLPQQNVDFGGGLERLLAATNNEHDTYKTDSFLPIIERLEEQTGKSYEDNTQKFRIIADHIKAATFLIKDGVIPSNKLQGYILRRLIRRAAIKLDSLKPDSMEILTKLIDPVIDIYSDTDYFQTGDWENIRSVVEEEVAKFQKTLAQGLREINRLSSIDGKSAFNLYQTYGFPIELTTEIAKEKGQSVDIAEFQKEVEAHRMQSQTSSAGMFKGGLVDHSDQTTKLHTATHLLQAALKQVLGSFVGQRGSHITAQRLRFDFNFPQKLTDEEIKQVEDLVNQKIAEDLNVHFDIEDRDQAISKGVTTNYGEKYPDKVKVYKIGSEEEYFSKELCGGPHVEHTGVLKSFKITKEESVSAGVRRLYAEVE